MPCKSHQTLLYTQCLFRGNIQRKKSQANYIYIQTWLPAEFCLPSLFTFSSSLRELPHRFMGNGAASRMHPHCLQNQLLRGQFEGILADREREFDQFWTVLNALLSSQIPSWDGMKVYNGLAQISRSADSLNQWPSPDVQVCGFS